MNRLARKLKILEEGNNTSSGEVIMDIELIDLILRTLVIILVGVGSVIWAESAPTDRDIWLNDVRYQVRKR